MTRRPPRPPEEVTPTERKGGKPIIGMIPVITAAGSAGDLSLETMSAQTGRRVPPPRAPRSGFISRAAVAGLFGVSVSTVTRWARQGLLAAVRTPGGQFRFRADEMRRAARAGSPDDLTRLD